MGTSFGTIYIPTSDPISENSPTPFVVIYLSYVIPSYSPPIKPSVPPIEPSSGTLVLSPESRPTYVLYIEPLSPPRMIQLINQPDFLSCHPISMLSPSYGKGYSLLPTGNPNLAPKLLSLVPTFQPIHLLSSAPASYPYIFHLPLFMNQTHPPPTGTSSLVSTTSWILPTSLITHSLQRYTL